ncbi:MAG: AIR synthase-related protein [Eisenbergiella sp.]
MVQEAENVCQELNMEIFGGHTEVTDVVKQPLICDGRGKSTEGKILSPDRIHPGQDIVIKKWIGLKPRQFWPEREERLLTRFSPHFIRQRENLSAFVRGARARAAIEAGVTAMHDITEGGVFGALWEIAEAGGVGLSAISGLIPLRQETVEICEFFG